MANDKLEAEAKEFANIVCDIADNAVKKIVKDLGKSANDVANACAFIAAAIFAYPFVALDAPAKDKAILMKLFSGTVEKAVPGMSLKDMTIETNKETLQ